MSDLKTMRITEERPDIASSTDDYATRFSGAIGSWFLDVQEQATLRFLRPYGSPSKVKIVDVGGGHAQNIEGLLRNGLKVTVTGSDQSCALRLQPFISDPSLSFTVCPLSAIPVEDQHFDVCLSYRMLSHLQHWPEFVAELCRVSRDRVIVDYPTYRSVNLLNSLFFRLKKGVERNTREFTIFHEKEIVEVFHENGFELEGRVGQYSLPMTFHRMHKWVPFAKGLEGVCRALGISWLFGSPVIACFRRKESQ